MISTRRTWLVITALLMLVMSLNLMNLSEAIFTSRTSSEPSRVNALSDWNSPQLTLISPSSPTREIVHIEVFTLDLEGSAVSVDIEISALNTNTWSSICTSSSAIHTCVWDTTAYDDGSYDLRATATDESGNTSSVDEATHIVVNNRMS